MDTNHNLSTRDKPEGEASKRKERALYAFVKVLKMCNTFYKTTQFLLENQNINLQLPYFM